MKNISFEALKDLENNRTGLSDKEVISQRLKYGDNKIVEAINHPWLDLVKNTLKDPMIWFLLVIGIIFYFVGDKTEAFTLLIAILPITSKAKISGLGVGIFLNIQLLHQQFLLLLNLLSS